LRLESVYPRTRRPAPPTLYALLAERTPEQSISHKAMPTMEEHIAFVDSVPYEAWYIVLDDLEDAVGACYLSKQREIGVSIFKAWRGMGYGKWAVQELMRLHPGKFLANVAPTNPVSAHMFARLGFNLIQHTYAK
jgi:RimJ/RimL family protein N-acetyltransferase